MVVQELLLLVMQDVKAAVAVTEEEVVVGTEGRWEVSSVRQAEAVVEHQQRVGRLAVVAVAQAELVPRRERPVGVEDKRGALRVAATRAEQV